MKKLLLLIILGITVTCCENFLDKAPLDQYSTATVYKSEQDVRYALNALYATIRGMNVTTRNPTQSEFIYSTFTDDAYDRSGSARSSDLGFYPTSSVCDWDYSLRYATIRQVNEFLARAPQAEKNIAPALYAQYIAEARVIRAMNYARMNFEFGAIPLMTEPTAPDFFPAKATRLVVFDFVTKEFQEAADKLPSSYTSSGDKLRITKGVALTLKARHLLNALDWYTPKADLYNQARIAVQAVYDSKVYSLEPGAAGFQKLFNRASANGASKETMLTITYNNDYKFNQYPACILPRGAYTGLSSSSINFTGVDARLVEAYQMKTNGLDVHNPLSGYDPANPWTNRDPRLDVTVLRAGEIIPILGGDGKNNFYVYDAHPLKNPVVLNASGVAYPTVTSDDVNKSALNQTGYQFQKYMVFDFVNMSVCDMHYHYLRFAETILLYAEAVLGETNNITLASSLVDEVRSRVGMPNVATSYGAVTTTQQMLDIIIRERRLEFATEGPQRWFDIRRFHLGETVFADKNVYGIPLGTGRKADAKVNDGDLDDSKKVIAGVRSGFDPATYYLWPIPQVSLNANPNLTSGQ